MTRRHYARLLAIGVLLIFGGEAFCVFGPLRYERVVHVVCHAIFYAGIAVAAIAALGWYGRARA
jgi:hypothetical protein